MNYNRKYDLIFLCTLLLFTSGQSKSLKQASGTVSSYKLIAAFHARKGLTAFNGKKAFLSSSVETYWDEDGNLRSYIPNWRGEGSYVRVYEWLENKYVHINSYLSDSVDVREYYDPYQMKYADPNHFRHEDEIDISNYPWRNAIPNDISVLQIVEHDIDSDAVDEIIVGFKKQSEISAKSVGYIFGIIVIEKVRNDYWLALDYNVEEDREFGLYSSIYYEIMIKDINQDEIKEALLYFVMVGGSSYSNGILVFAKDVGQEYSSCWNNGDGEHDAFIQRFEEIYKTKPWEKK